eukprot:COSAG05_NODE_2481_length_3006_cov_849.928793_4_plen_174_part_00
MPRAPTKPESPTRVARRSLGNRWVCLAAGFVNIICAGTVYGFGAVRADLKRELEDNDDTHIAVISLMGNCGLWFGSFLGGILADTRGPRVAMLSGAALFLLGYGGMYLALSRTVDSLRHFQIVAAMWLCAGLGSGFVYNATIFTNAQNFGVAGRCAPSPTPPSLLLRIPQSPR